MKTHNLVALAALSVLVISPVAALAEGNFYIAGSIGSANLDENFDGFNVDADSTAFRLIGGWRFNEHFRWKAAITTSVSSNSASPTSARP